MQQRYAERLVDCPKHSVKGEDKIIMPEFQATDDAATIMAGLSEAGCAVIHNVQTPAELELFKTQLAPHMEAVKVAASDAAEDFYPAKTRRVSALMARSEQAQKMALNPVINSLCQQHLGDNCERYQLHVSAALEVGPGAREQVLHREEDPFQLFPLPRPNLVIACMWAISDFKKENGATLLVPGSHKWPEDRVACEDEVISAEMPKGSVMVWLGGTLHAAGENYSDEWRYGVILSYSLAWLRQEENQYLDVPPAIAEKMPPELQTLIGYPMHGALGFYDPRVSQSS